MNENEWIADRKFVLEAIRSGSVTLTKMAEDVAAMKSDIHLLKFKSSLWGALAGALTVAAAKWLGKG